MSDLFLCLDDEVVGGVGAVGGLEEGGELAGSCREFFGEGESGDEGVAGEVNGVFAGLVDVELLVGGTGLVDAGELQGLNCPEWDFRLRFRGHGNYGREFE